MELETLSAGDVIKVNDWEENFIVKCQSQNYIVAVSEDLNYYTIIYKIKDNNGKYYCGADDWVLFSPLIKEYSHLYRFDNNEMNLKYLDSLEQGETRISLKYREYIDSLIKIISDIKYEHII